MTSSPFTFVAANGAVTITGYTGTDPAPVIPATLNGQPVTRIGAFAFANKTTLTRVTIPASVTSIGEQAFAYCGVLTDILVDPANPNFSSLDGVLFNKDQTTLLQWPGGRTGDYAVPASVTGIEAYAFAGGAGLTGVVIPASVTSIGDYAFFECTGLASLTLGNGVTRLAEGVFAVCPLLTSVTIPAGVTEIALYAFYGCLGLTEVTIPASVTSIGEGAFMDSSNLLRARFAGNAPSLGPDVFTGAAAGFKVEFSAGATGFTTPMWEGYPAVALSPPSITNHPASQTIASGTTARLTVAATGNPAPTFQWYQGISGDTSNPIDGATSDSFTSPVLTTATSYWVRVTNTAGTVDSDTATITVGSPASDFTWTSDGSAITITGYTGAGGAVTIPGLLDGLPVVVVGHNAFVFNHTLTSVTFPASLTRIGEYAFFGCSNLMGVTIPPHVTQIGARAFEACAALFAIEVDSANPAYRSTNGVLFDKAGTTLLQFPAGKGGGYVIPESVIATGGWAFANSNLLTSVQLPASLTSLGWEALSACNALMRITVDPANPNYRDIDGVLFNKDATTLLQYPGGRSGHYVIPEGVSGFDTAFAYCRDLTLVTIPPSVTRIGAYAFFAARRLAGILFEGDAPDTVGAQVFGGARPEFSVYFQQGASGFTTPTWQGYPASMIALEPAIDSLRHRWSFDTPLDAAGTAHLELHGMASLSNGQLELPGSTFPRTNYASVPIGNTIASLDSMTVEAWVTIDAHVLFAKLWFFGDSAGGNQPQLAYAGMTGQTPDGTAKLDFDPADGPEINTTAPPNSPSPSPGEPHHIAAVYDSSQDEMILYIDGARVDSGGMGGRKVKALGFTPENYLGAVVQYSDWDLDGRIDEMRIWDRPLSSAEIS
ncbi:MAG: leucine-rich repeat protein, partial [Akkermansiaceae bacterium]|nr:leucine-rich repeat protein [Akkermansiaceae bacterium]